MTDFTPLAGLTGGILIGLSAVLLMGGLGRVAGISGIFGALLGRWQPDNAWRLIFIIGMGLLFAVAWRRGPLRVKR